MNDQPLDQLFRLLAEGNASALARFADLLVTDPPKNPEDVLAAFSPLFKRRDLPAESLFPRLLDGLESPMLAGAVLDLSNYLSRSGRMPRHPAADRTERLAGLLSAVVQRLQILQEQGGPAATAAGDKQARQQAAQQVADSIALCVSLCDALALIGNPAVAGKIRPALELGHRRLRTEAAWALARLGETEGIDTLAALAVEPVARLRVLAYLDELGELDRANEQFRTPLARAEAELACWLAEPAQFGFPPHQMELVDERRLYWPGYDVPQECFLFRYSYPLPAGRVTGIGIAGPTTLAVGGDLEDLPPADIYALYAGATVDHAEIRERDAAALAADERRAIERRLHSAAADEYTGIELINVGQFFEETLVVAMAEQGGRPGVIVLDGPTVHWYPRASGRAPLGPTEAYWLHIGRKILRTFNPA